MPGPDRDALSDDALNRFRITHPDRDLRPLLRRLHRLQHPKLSPNREEGGSSTDDEERERERESLTLEVLKWKANVERLLGSVGNLERQRAVYIRKAEETAARTEELKAALVEEKRLLARKLKERDQQIKCDAVAARILAKPKSRKELDEQIALLRGEIENHAASHMLYTKAVQDRIEVFSRITPIIDEVKSISLPIEPAASLEDDKMEVDGGSPQEAGASAPLRLSAQALPFQPAPPPSPASKPGDSSSTQRAAPAQSSSQNSKPPPSSAGLPARPSRAASSGPGSAALARSSSSSRPSTLPARPSGLRSSTLPAGRASLEEGELGAEEEGEVSEPRTRGARASRSRK